MRKFLYAKRKLNLISLLLSSVSFLAAFFFDSFDQLFIFKTAESSNSTTQSRAFVTKRIYSQKDRESLSIEITARSSKLDSYKLFHQHTIEETLNGITLEAEEKKEKGTTLSQLKAKDGSFNLSTHQLDLSSVFLHHQSSQDSSSLDATMDQAQVDFSKAPFSLKALNFKAKTPDAK